MNESEKSRRKLLLVEDNPGDVLLFSEALKEAGITHDLMVAADGIDAMRMLQELTDARDRALPDMILLDLNLPRMDGRELLAWIKGDALLRRIPVVVLTTSRSETDIRRCYDLHANCYVVKPIDLEAAFATVAAIEKFWLHVALVPNETTR